MSVTRTKTRRPLLPALLLVVLAALSAACGAAGGATPDPVDPAPGATVVARPAVDTAVFAEPGDAAPVQVLPATNEFGSPLALVVVEQQPDGWLLVELPTRPNASSARLRASPLETPA